MPTLPVLPTQGAFSADMFPHMIRVFNASYVQGVTGGASRVDGTGVLWLANVQIAAIDKLDHQWPDSGQAAGASQTWNVSVPPSWTPPGGTLQTWPGVKSDDSIEQVNPTNTSQVIQQLIANGEEASGMRGAVLYVRCRRDT